MKEAPSRIRLVAVDLDGTLLDPSGKLTEHTIATIKRAQAEGVIVAICTGRFFENASILLKDAGLDCPIVAFNGGLTAEGPFRQPIARHRMDRRAAQTVFGRLEELEAMYYLFGDGLVATRFLTDRHHSLIHYGDRMITEAKVRYTYGKAACEEAISLGIYKYYVHAGDDMNALLRLKDALQDLQQVALTQSSESNIEIIPPDVDKGTGVKDLAKHFGIPLQEVMCLGDQDNDVPMIKAAGWGVAMGNATPEVIAAADAVTLSNAEDGVAEAIIRYALGASSGSGQAK